jgi:triacylglycerol lipase
VSDLKFDGFEVSSFGFNHPNTIHSAYTSSMLPVVLHHGLLGYGDVKFGPVKLRYFRGIDRAIADMGHPLILPGVHPTGSIARRAAELKEFIVTRLSAMGQPDQKVILMAHSMGGLDARYAVSKLGLDKNVAAIVTVTTPHRGSPFADWVVRNIGQRLRINQVLKFLKLDWSAISDVTTASCAKFNEEVTDVPGIGYFSISAARPWHGIAPMALLSHRVVYNLEGDNDGLVSLKSSPWGTHLGTWQADHWHTINRRWVPEFNSPTGDIAPLWVRLLQTVQQTIPCV